MGLHNLSTDEWAESMSPSGLNGDESGHDDDSSNEILSEEEQRIQTEKINVDLKRLEKYLDEFDYFSGKSQLDRHKLRFNADYLKARAIYYDNIMVFPKTSSQEDQPVANSEEGKEPGEQASQTESGSEMNATSNVNYETTPGKWK